MTPAERQQRSLAAHASWARTHDRTQRTQPARDGLEATIASRYDIPADLPAAEYAVRIESARRAYFRTMAAKSRRVRAARKAAS